MHLQFQTVDVFTGTQFCGQPTGLLSCYAKGLVLLGRCRPRGRIPQFGGDDLRAWPPKQVRYLHRRRSGSSRRVTKCRFAGSIPMSAPRSCWLVQAIPCQWGVLVDGDRVVFEEKAGLVPIEILRDGASVVGARLASPQPLWGRRRDCERTRGFGLAEFRRLILILAPSSSLHRVVRRPIHSGRIQRPVPRSPLANRVAPMCSFNEVSRSSRRPAS